MQRKYKSVTPTSSSLSLTRLRSDSVKSDPGSRPHGSRQSHPAQSSLALDLDKLRSPIVGVPRDSFDINVTTAGIPSSPVNQELELELDAKDTGSESVKKKKVHALKRCPCGLSSGGQAWLLKCTDCTQSWHNSCANLKGNIPKSVIDKLDHWLCPWCFVPPYSAPKNHKSNKNKDQLSNVVTSDSLISQMEDAVKSCVTQQNDELIESIRSELDKFSKGVNGFSQQARVQPQPEQGDTLQETLIESIKTETPAVDVQETPVKNYTADFITEEEADKLKTFLDNEVFVKEGQREVVSYGATYKYMGAKSVNAKPIPEELQQLLDKANFSREYALNQILINKFVGPEASLVKHSDNEYDINPSSDIVTVSLGDTAHVTFSAKSGNESSEVEIEHRSMYTMTRSSQNKFNHQINGNPANTLRYSITMRCVHWTYLNSLYAVGDSNFGHLKFGEGRGRIGKSTPGMKDFAACVEDIDPSKTMSHKNVVTMCGTNNLKTTNADVKKIYQVYKGKLEEIRQLNPRCNIFVCPVLPSRDQSINDKIFEFNRLLFDDLVHSGLRINLVRGLNVFLDKNFLLKAAFHDKRTTSDVLHINGYGYSALVKCIKTALFGAKNKTNHIRGSNTATAWGNHRQ